MADLIAAVSTGRARSAIGVIRTTGDSAINAAARVFRAKNGQDMEKAESGKLILGVLTDKDGRAVDQCLCVINRGPRSYTGEDTAEFQCHGSPAALAEGLSALYAAGARPAEPGEFTKRAFLNGKLGLTEAEAVMDVIDAETPAALRNAAGQLGGAIARRAEEVYSRLLDISSHFHAVIDWPDEDIGEFELSAYADTLASAERELAALLKTAERGKFIKNGVKCAIVGKPNVGKSSLLNALAGFRRAIVTDVAGTTRDTLEERVVLGGHLLRLTDTAGIRETADEIEKQGVARAEEAAEDAGLVIAVFDGSAPLTAEDGPIIGILRSAGAGIAVFNKSDLGVKAALPEGCGKPVAVSALRGEGLDALAAAVDSVFPETDAAEGEILTNARQAGEVLRARDAVAAARASLVSGMTPDAVLTDVEDALSAIAAMTGREIHGDIVTRIFERFCVGK